MIFPWRKKTRAGVDRWPYFLAIKWSSHLTIRVPYWRTSSSISSNRRRTRSLSSSPTVSSIKQRLICINRFNFDFKLTIKTYKRRRRDNRNFLPCSWVTGEKRFSSCCRDAVRVSNRVHCPLQTIHLKFNWKKKKKSNKWISKENLIHL